MHEWSLVKSVVEEIIKQAKENDIKKIDSVRLGIGEDEHIIPETLKICFRSLTNDTILDGTDLEIEKSKGRGIVILSIEGEK